MAKRKKPAAPKNDSKAAMIVIALFAVIILSVFYFSKKKESNQEQNKVVKLHIIHKVKPHPLYEAVDSYIPNENIKPVESLPTSTATEEPVEITHGSGERIAFIIDDWGQSMANCKYLKEIPEPMAVSILPGLRHTQDVANCAMQNHKLAMLHLPLEALHNNDFYPPNYIIKTTMNPDLASKIIDADLNQLPSIEGVNNHMGSKATEDRPLMRLIFKKIKKRGLFFVDSMTAHKTVCASFW